MILLLILRILGLNSRKPIMPPRFKSTGDSERADSSQRVSEQSRPIHSHITPSTLTAEATPVEPADAPSATQRKRACEEHQATLGALPLPEPHDERELPIRKSRRLAQLQAHTDEINRRRAEGLLSLGEAESSGSDNDMPMTATPIRTRSRPQGNLRRSERGEDMRPERDPGKKKEAEE